MNEEVEKTPPLENTDSDADWENRKLCIDGNCIGVIGPDGRCKECGKTYEGDSQQVDDPLWSTDDESDDSEEKDTFSGTDEETPSDDDWENRKLCSDGNCIGVIGPDGSCKECGNPYQPDE
jgi:hypothetical protein